MMNLRKSLTTTVLAATLFGITAAQTQPIAVVNGTNIGYTDYVRRMEFLPGVGRLIGDRFEPSYPGYLALQALINEELMLQLAREKNVFPKDADVQASLKERLAQNPKMLEVLATAGITQKDVERSIQVEQAEFNITTMGITVTDQEVEQHYKDNPSRFTIPKRYKLRLIAVPETKKQKVDDALKAGKTFGDVAKEFSEDSSSKDGGSLGEVPVTMFSVGVQNSLDATKIGSATDWIQGNTGWFKFFVEDIKPQEKVPLDAKLKVRLRKELMYNRGIVKNNVEKMMQDIKKRAKVTVSNPALEPIIKAWLGQ